MGRIVDGEFIDQTQFLGGDQAEPGSDDWNLFAYFGVDQVSGGTFQGASVMSLKRSYGYTEAGKEHIHLFPYCRLEKGRLLTSDGRVAMICKRSDYEEAYKKKHEKDNKKPLGLGKGDKLNERKEEVANVPAKTRQDSSLIATQSLQAGAEASVAKPGSNPENKQE